MALASMQQDSTEGGTGFTQNGNPVIADQQDILQALLEGVEDGAL
jgi:hypothetical protein